jgi:hypothetical protein
LSAAPLILSLARRWQGAPKRQSEKDLAEMTKHDRLMDKWLDAPNDYAREQARRELDRHIEIARLAQIAASKTTKGVHRK